MIQVKNEILNLTIEVCISHWFTEGNTDFFPIGSYTTETWQRDDKRGFVMVVKKGKGLEDTYFVQFDSKIDVEQDKVTDRGKTIHPIKHVGPGLSVAAE